MTSTTMDLDPPTSLKDKVRHLLDQPNEPTTDRLLVKTAQRPTSMVRHEAFHDAFVCGGRIELGYQMYTTAGDDWDSDDNAKAEESRQGMFFEQNQVYSGMLLTYVLVFTTKAIAKRICEDRDHEEVGDGPRILIQFLHQLHDDVIDHLIIGDTGFQLATDPTFHDKFMAPDSCAGLYVVAISTKPGGGFLTGMELKRFVRVGRRFVHLSLSQIA